MSDPRLGEWVHIEALRSRTDLNGRRGKVVRYHCDVQRWEIHISESHTLQRVRLRRPNFARDRIVVQNEGEEICVEWPAWPSRNDPDGAALKLVIDRCKDTGMFSGKVVVHSAGAPPRQVLLPWLVALTPKSVPWDAAALIRGIAENMPPSLTVEQAEVAWTLPTDDAFGQSVTSMIRTAHARSDLLQVAVRTAANTARFTQLHALSGENIHTLMACAGVGTVICEPTDAIAFHRDNLVKLPTSLSLAQAVRKVTEMVENGCDVECCICMEDMSRGEDIPVFMPCPCKASIHLACLRKLRERSAACPLCRAPLTDDVDTR